MKVIAAKGKQVPREDKPRVYIGDELIVEVPRSAYYLRRIAGKELLESTEAAFTAQQDNLAKAAAKAAKAVKPQPEGAA